MKKKRHKHYNLIVSTLFLLILFLLLSGCEQQKPKEKLVQKKETLIKEMKTLKLPKEQFEKIVGWLDDETLLYTIHQNKESLIFKYHLITGKSDLIFKSEKPIKTVVISPDHSKILVQTSPLTYLAKIYILDRSGKTLFAKEMESYDLAYDWNERNTQFLAISVFFEDWTFKVFILNLNDSSISEYDFSDPFIKWFGKDTILSQVWDKKDIRLKAPLVSYSLNNIDKQTTLLKNIYHFDTLYNFLFTITVDSDNNEQARYHFYDHSLKEVYSFHIPHLSQYNDWLIPNYDFSEKENRFLTFVPYESGSIDEYEQHYKLVSYRILNKKEDVLFEHLQNEPITCSPNGEVCLYGFQYEKILDLKTKKIVPIVEYKK
ncbi:hypothetical protein ACQKP0_08070 [Heyndrickxia sp. NPDC080065]|uniref:YqgU-like beta propeller domain-containing protein n=1 Tax=Heyndrickxia sp. NPDC080065 TaxID=3390568 RepID=UPI003D045F72